MKILTIDIGTGTQDIFLFDSRLDVENGYKLILPSPTMQAWKQISEAARKGEDVAISGIISGGGPSCWAVENHLRSGLKVYATREAAKTLDDDLDKVAAMGVILVSEDEMTALPSAVKKIELCDFNYRQIEDAFALFGISLIDLNAAAVAVFDHGNAPQAVSDRKFRFDFFDLTLRESNRLSAFAYPQDKIPARLTRMQAVASSAGALTCPLIIMDSAPAAILGATLDPFFKRHDRNLVVNIGNGHTLASRLGPAGIEGLFEHHTGLLNPEKLDGYLGEFAAGTLTNEKIFNDHGHGALINSSEPLWMDHADFNYLVTGPKQSLARHSTLKPHFAAPFGDMMLTGCFGLLSALAELHPEMADEIHGALNAETGNQRSPWDLVD